ncbi:TIGR03621 family F420-dependent LLM class oxidoreductase [Nocardia sp. NPDC051321]|uniref:TIGR03621 family F420-dependent LLM class oxidoreductase n=1 Tax=Nocardia sp. NPDC051321 TaxID=3364323 RepID=UPI003799DF81
MSRTFRFGVQASGAYTAGAWRDKAREVEALGYSSLLIPDHLDTQWGPLVAMTVAAEATERLTVGTLVLANDYRNPVVLAKEIATLDVVSGGRVEFGIGAGWREMDYRAAGVTFDPAAERIDRLGESLAIMKDIWATAAVRRTGAHYAVSTNYGHPQPISAPYPPILIGGGGKRMLSLAAREADIVGVNPKMSSGRMDSGAGRAAVDDAFDERIGWIRDAAGDRWGDIELQCLVVTCRITADREASVRTYAKAIGMTEDEFGATPMALVGSVDEICDQLIKHRERWGFTYWVVSDGAARAFAPVVARLTGS